MGVTSFLTHVRNAVATYKGTVGDPMSLADISKIARVEPITLVSGSLVGVKELYEILHGVLNIYASYYLQAVSILSADLSDIRILKILDKTNPDRDIKTFLTAGYHAVESIVEKREKERHYNGKTMCLENAKFKLPMLVSDRSKSFSMESIWDEDEFNNLGNSINKIDTFEKLGAAVGKIVDVRFKVGDKIDPKKSNEISIPVSFKLDTMLMPAEVMTSIMASNKEEITLSSRFKKAMAGRIGFIKEFILCSDLIKSQKKSMIKDPTSYYTAMLKRINNSRIYSALSGNISLAGVSSIFVISEEEENEIQRNIGGKLTSDLTRDMVFANSSAMMIVVISQSWERVTIYVRDIDGFSQNSFSDFKNMASKESSMLSEVLKAFQLNSPPSF